MQSLHHTWRCLIHPATSHATLEVLDTGRLATTIWRAQRPQRRKRVTRVSTYHVPDLLCAKLRQHTLYVMDVALLKTTYAKTIDRSLRRGAVSEV